MLSVKFKILTLRTHFKARGDPPASRYLNTNKFALLWGEAQLCSPYVCLKKVMTYSDAIVT